MALRGSDCSGGHVSPAPPFPGRCVVAKSLQLLFLQRIAPQESVTGEITPGTILGDHQLPTAEELRDGSWPSLQGRAAGWLAPELLWVRLSQAPARGDHACIPLAALSCLPPCLSPELLSQSVTRPHTAFSGSSLGNLPTRAHTHTQACTPIRVYTYVPTGHPNHRSLYRGYKKEMHRLSGLGKSLLMGKETTF